MKEIDKVFVIINELCTPLEFDHIKKLLGKIKKKFDRLTNALDQSLEVITTLRYQNWPTSLKGIHADDLDMIIKEGDRTLRSCNYTKPKES